MKNLVKVSIFALALGFFASCSESEAPATETTPATTEAAAPVEATPATTDSATAATATEATATEAAPAADTAAKH
jgi:hypothetical protein